MKRIVLIVVVLFAFALVLRAARTFGGASSDIISCASNSVADNLAAFTVIAWTYPTDWGGGWRGRIVDKNAVRNFVVDNSNTKAGISLNVYRATTNCQVNSGNSAIALNGWVMVAAT